MTGKEATFCDCGDIDNCNVLSTRQNVNVQTHSKPKYCRRREITQRAFKECPNSSSLMGI